MLFILFVVISLPVFCANFNFDNSFVSDNGNFLAKGNENALEEVLKNLSDETGCDLVVLTLDGKFMFNGSVSCGIGCGFPQ